MARSTNYNNAVDAYINKSAEFAQPILDHIRKLMHDAVPDVEEAIKWSHPFFVHHGVILANMAGFKAHCSLGLWGAEITRKMNDDGVASAGSMGSFGRITSIKELPARKEMLAYIRQAAKLIEEGRRTKAWERPKKAAKPDVEVPPSLAASLKKNKVAAKHFAAMSPSCQREYCDWIADAKREETRDKRLATALDWIAEGKSRNWKYEKC